MKTNSLFSFIVTLILMVMIQPAFAQVDIEVKVIQAQMSKGTQPCYVVDIPRGVLKDIQENWVRKLQENNKVKVVNNDGELVFSGIKSEISTDSIFVYTLFIEKEEWVVMNVFVEVDSVFFSPTEDKTQLSAEKTDNAIKSYMRNFAVEQYRLDATEDLEVEQKLLEQLQDEYDKLVKENENLKKDISSLENDIDKTERSITELEKEIELKNQEALTHTTGMASLATEPEKKAAEDKKKDLEKEKNKLEKDRTGYKNDISDMKSDIEKNQKQIEENTELQEEKQAAIDAQAEEVKKAQATLDGIK